MLRLLSGVSSQDEFYKLPGHWLLARMGKRVLRPGGRKLTEKMVRENGFEVQQILTAPMHLLRPARIVEDEGLARALRIGFNLLRNPAARERIPAMRTVFDRYLPCLEAVSLIAIKKAGI